MSFTDDQVGIETYDGSIQLLFPHPPVILDRFTESGVDRDQAISIKGTVTSVQWLSDQPKRELRLLVKTMTAAQMATLETLKGTTGLFYVKIAAGVATKILCDFQDDGEQEGDSMVAPHAETKGDGSAIDDIFKVYETEIALVRIE